MDFMNSLLYWYPKIKDTGIPMPPTSVVILKKPNDDLLPILDGDFSPIEPQWNEILQAAQSVGYPLFMRTDEFSGKHSWKHTCYVEKDGDLKSHIRALFDESFAADIFGLPIRALVFRKYIPMMNLFLAFPGDMPVNPEMRLFTAYGNILCRHWYWQRQAIKGRNLPPNWEEILEKTRVSITRKEMGVLASHALEIAHLIKGCWSIGLSYVFGGWGFFSPKIFLYSNRGMRIMKLKDTTKIVSLNEGGKLPVLSLSEVTKEWR